MGHEVDEGASVAGAACPDQRGLDAGAVRVALGVTARDVDREIDRARGVVGRCLGLAVPGVGHPDQSGSIPGEGVRPPVEAVCLRGCPDWAGVAWGRDEAAAAEVVVARPSSIQWTSSCGLHQKVPMRDKGQMRTIASPTIRS